MITIKDVKTLEGTLIDHQIPSVEDVVIDAKRRLILLPGLIDSHLCLGSPEHQSWQQGVQSAVQGGITTVIDIPNKELPCHSKIELEQKKKIIEEQLASLKKPLNFLFYSFPNFEHVNEMGLMKPFTKGVAIVLTAELNYTWDEEAWDRVFQLAAWEDLPVVVNSQNENQLPTFSSADQSLLEKALYYTEKQGTCLYVLNISTSRELELIKQARSKNLLIYVETTPRHLFPAYQQHADFLWKAINEGVIDAVGTGFHAGIPDAEMIVLNGVSFSLSDPCLLVRLLTTAYLEGKISLEKIVQTTCLNVSEIFKLTATQDVVLLDLEKSAHVTRISQEQSEPMILKGSVAYTIIQGQIFDFFTTIKN